MSRQISTFMVGETLLGLNILIIKEVYRHMEITPIPDAPAHMSGLMNLRGRVVTVIDLNVCLEHARDENIESRNLLILKTDSDIQQYQQQGMLGNVSLGTDIVGFLIDEMKEVLDVGDEDILPTPPNLDQVDRTLVKGVIKLENKLVLLLDINAVLESILNISKENTR